MEFNEFMNRYHHKIDEESLQFLNTLTLSENLRSAIIYSYSAGGKRLRPLLLLSTLKMFREDINKGIQTAVALEFIHTSSLIHDDLPAMDNDDYRRGKLTNHKMFGEATAILAGDALLVNAFQLITQDPLITNEQKILLVNELARCSGANGMIGGQQYDIENESQVLSLKQLMKIDEHKTGKLLEFPLVAAAIIAGKQEYIIRELRKVAYHIGIAFQIKDDLLDVTGDQVLIGKPVKSDEKNNKCTYVSLLGVENATKELKNHYQQAVEQIKHLQVDDSILLDLFQYIIERNK